jgi:hypothetical protein
MKLKVMPKVLTYLILPNHLLYSEYKNSNSKVFSDINLKWNALLNISGYWGEFEYRAVYNYKTLMTKLKKIVGETELEPCDYNKERLMLFTNLYNQLKIGETLFIQYDDM